MTGTPVRVSVHPGSDTVRVAGAAVDGEPWVVAQLPAPGPGVAALLTELVGARPEELVLVHPGRWPRERAAVWVAGCAGLARRVLAVPAPVAAAAHQRGSGATGAQGGPIAVLDVGAAHAEAAWVAHGVVQAWRTAHMGGRTLDDGLAARLGTRAGDVRRVREALSLLPEVDGVTVDELRDDAAGPLGLAVDALRDLLVRSGPAPVLLVGGLARMPLLAELVDATGIPDVAVARRPDVAAVLGALARRPLTGPPAAAEITGSGCTPLPAQPSAPDTGDHRDPPACWLPPPRPRRRRPLRAVLLTAVAAGSVAGLVALGGVLAPPSVADAVPDGVLVQYGYRLDLPAGWEHTGGRPERRRTLLTPVAAPDGSDLIAVERSPLGYDSDAEPEWARAELRAHFDAAVAAGSALAGYDPVAHVAGRVVTTYRQQDTASTVVEWFVVLDRDAQLSVGCRHTEAKAARVRAACAVVVASVRRA